MSRAGLLPPVRIVRLATCLLPPQLRAWGAAAAEEVQGIESRFEAWAFALGFLGWTIREAVGFRFSTATPLLVAHLEGKPPMLGLTALTRRPMMLGVFCAIAATAAGLIYLKVAGAPLAYLVVNVGALVFGFIMLAALSMARTRDHLNVGAVNLTLGLVLLAVALWGTSADGVTRWVSVGGLSIQPGLIVVPLMAVLFARSRDRLSLLGIAIAAAALALQPDRATAGALAAGFAVLTFIRPERSTALAAGASAIGFAVTVARPDPSPAVPYVDQILHTALAVHPVAGLAVLGGSVLLMVPALAARRTSAEDQAAYSVFGMLWAGLVVAAALGNYPTPLVGYGGSAIIGYVVSLMAFGSRQTVVAGHQTSAAAKESGEPPPLATAH